MRFKLFAVFAVLILVVAACGGSSGDADPDPAGTQATTGDTAAPDPGTAPPGTEGGGGESEGSGPSTASVTLGGETYEFSSEGALVAQCLPDLFGIMSVQLPMVGGEGSIKIVALHEGTDPAEVEEINSVHVTIGDVDWLADPEDVNIATNADVPEGQSEVTSIEVDGSTVRGTANFAGSQTIFSADFVEFASGTFEATCGEERLS